MLVFLDFDGTLSPIVSNPLLAELPPATRSALIEVAPLVPLLGILTGRSLEKIKAFVGDVPNLTIGASHGFDVEGTAGVRLQVAEDVLPLLSRAADELRTALAQFDGASVEDNHTTISVHYRQVCDAQVETVRGIVRDYVQTSCGSKLELRNGHKVLEIRPAVQWDKGCALRYIIQQRGFNHAENLLIYVGASGRPCTYTYVRKRICAHSHMHACIYEFTYSIYNAVG